MFTWICPQCGKEVPPHETECPRCAEAAKSGGAAAAAPAGATPPPPPAAAVKEAPYVAQAPPVAPAGPPAAAAGPPVYYVGGQRGTPGWVVALLVAVGLCAAGAGFYYFTQRSKAATQAQSQAAPFEKVPAAGQGAASKIVRLIEVTGFRITEDARQRLQVQFLVVNHSAADLGDLAGIVHLRTTESKPGEKPLASVEFKTTRLGPYESVEFRTTTTTGLRAYELPDWQFLTADVEITSPSDL
ncbi:MAG: zinc ribbon domain-containing protein [Bryobacteraceae bacterium]|nr:zinc ribbon domain-containing protein [Bryobacteraceae bacterium]